MDTNQQFDQALGECRAVFAAKLQDYGASWRIMRPAAVTDQIFIKAKRIRSLQTKEHAAVDEGILSEFMAIVNYGIVGVIQLRYGYSDTKDMSPERALELYDQVAHEARTLMVAKNHDYDEAWRGMRVLSYTDLKHLHDVVSSKPLPADRVATTEGTELASLGPEEYAPLGQWLTEHAQQPVTVVLVGRRGKWQQKLSAAQVAALDQSYSLSTAVVQMFELQKEYDRRQRTLEIARKQSNK